MNRIKLCQNAITDPRLKELFTLAAKAALEAGAILKELYNKPHEINQKGEIDLVTEADLASEKAIISLFQKKAPEVRILSEESHSDYSSPPTGPCWVIDPLDGTTNYAHNFPWYAVSIAYMEKGVSHIGIVYHVAMDELFCACRGIGAWLNGSPMHVSSTDKLSDALMATGFPYDVHQYPDDIINMLKTVLIQSQGVRRAGAAALDLANVACGRLDGFWEVKLKAWDTAAGMLLVEEAGGSLSNFINQPYNPFLKEIIASNGLLNDKIVALLHEYSVYKESYSANRSNIS